MEQMLFEKVKICLNDVEYLIDAFRRQDVVTGHNVSKRLIQEVIQWYQLYISWVETFEESPEDYLCVADIIKQLCQAQETQDMILFSDIAELSLRPMFYQLQALLLQQGVSIVNYSVFADNVRMANMHCPNLCREIHLSWQETDGEEKLQQYYEQVCCQYVESGVLDPSSSGEPTFAFSEGASRYYAHSNVNPRWEGAKLARHYHDATQDNYLIYGLGLGYMAQNMLLLDEDMKLVIYERNADVIRMAMLCSDLRLIWQKENVTLIYDTTYNQLSPYMTEDWKIVIHEPSMRNTDSIKIREILNDIYTRDANQRCFEKNFQMNFRRNVENCQHYVDELKSVFKGKHAVIVAAGPSLDKNVDKLRHVPKDTLIIATGTVFRKLVHLDIVPDYVIFSDPKEELYVQVEGVLDKKIPLLILSTTYYKIAKHYQGEKYLICQNGMSMPKDYATKQGYDTYDTGGSVSTTALDVCIHLGCSEIAFVGLDLAYSNHQSHTMDAGKNDANNMELLKAETGVLGDTVYVCHAFQQYRSWIEKRLKKLSESECNLVIDATEGGVMIEGMAVMDMDAVLTRWNSDE